MLDKQDLQAIKDLIDTSISASEERTHAEIRAAEDRWMTFYESAIQPQLQLLAEGQQTILETLG